MQAAAASGAPRAQRQVAGAAAADGGDQKAAADQNLQQSAATAPRDEPVESGPWFLTKSQIDNSPSRKYLLERCGGDVVKAREKEAQHRRLTCAFLQESGQKLRLPQLSIATAIVFYHRFFAHKSYENYCRFTIATTCLFLASKVEETPKKLKDVVIETYRIQHGRQAPDPESQEFKDLKERILVSERVLLQTLGFDLTVEHAYRPLLAYVKSIQGTRDLAQVAWNFINDSLRTTICLQYAPRHVSAAAVYLAARYLSEHHDKLYELPPHQGGKWYDAFHVSEEAFQDVANQIMELYDSKANGGPALANGSNVALMSQKRLETLKSPASAPGPAAANGAAAADAGVPAPRTQREGGGSGAPAATGDGAATHGAGRDGATAEASSKREPTMAADDEQRSKRPRESIPALGTG